MTKPWIDWAEVNECKGAIGEFELQALEAFFSYELRHAVRDAFDVNGVPDDVVAALEAAESALKGAIECISTLGAVIANTYAARGLTSDGRKPDPRVVALLEKERDEKEAAADVARRSSHRPTS